MEIIITSGLQQQRLWKDVKNVKKALLLKFYKELINIKEHMQSRQVIEDEEEEGDKRAFMLYHKNVF